MECTACGKECFENTYPEIVFRDKNHCICEECSIDYEEIEGKIQHRKDDTGKYFCEDCSNYVDETVTCQQCGCEVCIDCAYVINGESICPSCYMGNVIEGIK